MWSHASAIFASIATILVHFEATFFANQIATITNKVTYFLGFQSQYTSYSSFPKYKLQNINFYKASKNKRNIFDKDVQIKMK